MGAPLPADVDWQVLQPKKSWGVYFGRVLVPICYVLLLIFYSVPISFVSAILSLNNLTRNFPWMRPVLDALGPVCRDGPRAPRLADQRLVCYSRVRAPRLHRRPRRSLAPSCPPSHCSSSCRCCPRCCSRSPPSAATRASRRRRRPPSRCSPSSSSCGSSSASRSRAACSRASPRRWTTRSRCSTTWARRSRAPRSSLRSTWRCRRASASHSPSSSGSCRRSRASWPTASRCARRPRPASPSSRRRPSAPCTT
jgi:hypothetical protein